MRCEPQHEVVVRVINNRGEAAVRVVLGELRRLLLAGLEVEEDGLVGQAELLENDRDLPVSATILGPLSKNKISRAPTIRWGRPCGSRE